MRKILFVLAVALLALTPAFAQHGVHQGGQRGGGQNTHIVRETQQHNQPRVEGHQRGEVRGGAVDRRTEGRVEGYGYSRGDEHGGSREHFRGGRFEDHFFVSHYGRDNRFYWGRCNWYGGPRFGIGSYFWFNDAYFVIVDPIPYDWYDDDVYVDYIDGGYYIISPYHPGLRFAVSVRF